MAAPRLSKKAEADLRYIFIYTRETWGELQAFRYFNKLDPCFQMLGANPTLGRPCDAMRPGLRKFDHARHVIYYRITRGKVHITRILHARMLPGNTIIDDNPS